MASRIQISSFGDDWETLAAVSHLEGCDYAAGPVISFGAFRVSERERASDYRRLRRDVQQLAVSNIIHIAPAAMVITLDAVNRVRGDRTLAIGKQLVANVQAVSTMLFAHRLPVVAVTLRSFEDRARVASALMSGHFLDAATYRGIVIETSELSRRDTGLRAPITLAP